MSWAEQYQYSNLSHQQVSLPPPVIPLERPALASWLGSLAARPHLHAADLAALAERLSAPDREVSLLVVVEEEDDPGDLLHNVAVQVADWLPRWELVLVTTAGSACETAALYLDGEYQMIRNLEPVPFGLALNQAALAARGRYLLIPGGTVGPLRLLRERFLALGGAHGQARCEVLAGLSRCVNGAWYLLDQ